MSISDKLLTLLLIKDSIKDAIIEKGVDVSDDDAFTTYADKILLIEGGGGSTDEESPISDGWSLIDGYWGYENSTVAVDGKLYKMVAPWHNDASTILCIFKGNITFYCESFGQGGDYLTVGNLDTPCTRSNYKYLLNNKIQKVSFLVDDEDEHYVQFCYSKDATGSAYPDNALIYMKSREYEEDEGGASVPSDFDLHCLFVELPAGVRINGTYYAANSTDFKVNIFEDYNISKITSLLFVYNDNDGNGSTYYNTSRIIKLPDVSNIDYNNLSFKNNTNLTYINLNNVNISSLTSMREMFSECNSLVSLDLSNFDFANITSLTYTFYKCTSLQEITMPYSITRSLTSLHDTFRLCENLTSLDLRSFTTDLVTDMMDTFSYCKKLNEILGIENWNTESVETMNYMFYNCGIKTLDINNWDVSNCLDFYSMFGHTSNLTNLDISNWDFSSATTLDGMFLGSGINSISLPNRIDLVHCTDMSDMFRNCEELLSIKLTPTFYIPTDLSFMFYGCKSLTSVDLSNWSLAGNTSLAYFFTFCESLERVDLTSWSNTHYITNMTWMFSECYSITSIDLRNFNTSNVTDMSDMFFYCKNITSLNLLLFNTSSVKNMSGMFCQCENLSSISFGVNFNTSNVTNMSTMFYGCYALQSVTIPDISNVTNISDTFGNSGLTSITLKGDPSKITNMDGAFYKLDRVIFKNGDDWVTSTGKRSGTLYYDSRYDYTNIINQLISDTEGYWSAVAI